MREEGEGKSRREEGKGRKMSKAEEEEGGEEGEKEEAWEKYKKKAERSKVKEEEMRREEKRERERREEEKRKERKRNNIVWKGLEEGEDKEECGEIITNMMRELTGETVKIRNMVERMGEGGRKVLIVELNKEEDKERILRARDELWRRWRIQIDEDLTMEERKTRWRMVERARRERRAGKRVIVTNRRMWVDGKEWRWIEEEDKWRELGEE